MPECHTCKWNGKGNAAACLACGGPDEGHVFGNRTWGREDGGRRHVASLEAITAASGRGSFDDTLAAGGAGSLAGAIGERPRFEAGEEAELAVRRMLDLLAGLPAELLLCFMALHRGRSLRQAVEIAARQTGKSGRTLWRSLALLRRNGAPAAALFGPAEAGPENGERGAACGRQRTENRKQRTERPCGATDEPEQLEFAL